MKRLILLLLSLALVMLPLFAAAEVRTYTEMVTIKDYDDDYSALNKAKEKAKEQALRSYLNDVYKERSATLNLTGEDKYFKDLEVVESGGSGGFFGKEFKAKVRVTINEEEVRAYLKRQGAVTGKNEDRRIFVLLIPGKMDSGDAPAILTEVRAEIRKNLTAAEFTVIDSDDQALQDTLTEDPDYDKLVAHINKVADRLQDRGEWLVLGKVDVDVKPEGSMMSYHVMMTGKAVSLASRSILWEGNIDGSSLVKSSVSPKVALRNAAIKGGKNFATEVLQALKTKELTQERIGARFEVIFPSGGNYKLERKILKVLKEDIKGLKNVSQKSRGKGDMVIDVFYAGKISDLVDLLIDNFEKDPELKPYNPEIEGNKVRFKK